VARFAALVETTSLPVFALGGVHVDNTAQCLEAGAYGIAVVSSIMSAADILQTVRAYLHVLHA
jgi:thiamine-phosphate pyrophosphorylase